MSRDFLTYTDLLFGPIAFGLIILFSLIITAKLDGQKKKIYFGGLFLKFVGVIAYAFIYNFYYNGGDTWLYHLDASLIVDTFYKDPLVGLELIITSPKNYSASALRYANESYSNYIFSPNSNLLIRIGAFFGVFTFKSYIAIAAWMSFYAFLGMWLFFKTFVRKYPHLQTHLAISAFFIPSIFFWSGGIMKDTIALGAVGFLVYAINNVFIRRKRILLSVVILFINIYIALNTKSYIVYMLVPATMVWLLFTNWTFIKSKVVRVLTFPVLVGILIIGFILGLQFMPMLIGQTMEEMINEIELTGTWITKVSERTGGSAYSLGEIDYTLTGLLKVAPRAIFVTLYQPFLWQANNLPMLMSAIEALFTLLFTLYVFLKVGPSQFFRRMFSNPDIMFCLIFTLGFAFFTGISTLNFGSLARYKLPVFPFYFAAMYMIYRPISRAQQKT